MSRPLSNEQSDWKIFWFSATDEMNKIAWLVLLIARAECLFGLNTLIQEFN